MSDPAPPGDPIPGHGPYYLPSGQAGFLLPAIVMLRLALPLGAAGQTPDVDELPRSAPPGVVVGRDTDTYPIEGSDMETLTASLRAGGVLDGRRRFAGFHQWRLRWRFEHQYRSGECVIRSATVYLSTNTTLPKWEPPPGVDSLLVERWNTYLAALRKHELGHYRLALAGAGRIREALLSSRAPRCELLQREANGAAQSVLTRVQAEDRKYDADTRHGATQGAKWPPPLAEPPRLE